MAVRLLAVLAAAFYVATSALIVYLVYRDAAARGAGSPRGLAFLVALLLPLSLVYVAFRRRLGTRAPPADRERALRAALLAHLIAIFGVTFAPPDPMTQLRYLGVGLAAAYPLAYAVVYRNGIDAIRTRVQ
ncbi:MAG: hypothetical protein ABEJ97_07365 [Halobellus sp.]